MSFSACLPAFLHASPTISSTISRQTYRSHDLHPLRRLDDHLELLERLEDHLELPERLDHRLELLERLEDRLELLERLEDRLEPLEHRPPPPSPLWGGFTFH